MMENAACITRAAKDDIDDILALYRSLIHMPYSTWNEHYPTLEMVEEDVQSHKVLIMRDECHTLISAVSIRYEFEFSDAAAWYRDVRKWAMLSRLGVHADYQRRGIARKMILASMEEACADGCDAVQFLVSKENPIAQRAYAPLGFEICGEAELFEAGRIWLCYQKRL